MSGFREVVLGIGSVLKIITRADATANGLKRYFTGERCLLGHVCERQTSNASCIECSAMRLKKYRAVNHKKCGQYAREYYHSMPAEQKNREMSRREKWAAKNADRVRVFKRRHELTNLDQHRRRKRLLERERNFWLKKLGYPRLSDVEAELRKAIKEVVAAQIEVCDFQRNIDD